ncbi:hypothetical protein ABG067_002712, partial [Albugo candida]
MTQLCCTNKVVVPHIQNRIDYVKERLPEIPLLSPADAKGHNILVFGLFKYGMQERPINPIFSIKWGDRPGPPVLRVVQPNHFDANKVIALTTVAPEKLDKPNLDLDDFKIECDGDNGAKENIRVSFNFQIVESRFLEWAYTEIKNAMPKDSPGSISCDQIPNLKLPTFKFTSDSLEIFTLSRSNYFLREPNDDICHLMVQHHESDHWVIGTPVTKTHEVLFYREDGTGNLKFGFRPLDKPS